MHALAALGAFGIGAFQLWRLKGDKAYRGIGYLWVAMMVVVAVSSFGINDIDQWRGFSLIHLLSVWALIGLPLAIRQARAVRIEAHRRSMISLFVGALVIAGLLTLLPGRIMSRVVFGG